MIFTNEFIYSETKEETEEMYRMGFEMFPIHIQVKRRYVEAHEWCSERLGPRAIHTRLHPSDTYFFRLVKSRLWWPSYFGGMFHFKEPSATVVEFKLRFGGK